MKTLQIHSLNAIALNTIIKRNGKNYKVIGNTQTIIVELQEVKRHHDQAKKMPGYSKEQYNEMVKDESDKCPHCGIELKDKMIDVDGTNLEEHKICPDCGYGTPALR